MSGTVGNFVTSPYRGQNVVRSKAFNPKDANSEAQQKHRNMFVMIRDEYSSFMPFVSFGFPGRPQSQSPFNAFVAANLPEAVDQSGEYPVIDYSKLVLSKGSLTRVNALSKAVSEQGVTIHYQTLGGNEGVAADDVVSAVMKTASGAVYSASKPRGKEETDFLLLPAAGIVPEDVLCIYLLVLSADKTKASKSVYVSVR